ncbi:putative transcriptional regulator, MerR family [Alkaliphilus metalliredigens QYMF]|uniref:Putative transcriptional regulator, MerR family n=1 Tax=Alkaliphilus metalliredigens (strain QYMF) TaxID=293826 RepID=A6TRF3_ALKMQ|nr:MerR family transcriptional regulator [Alkaliphilus metalliredigens]ABR48771.1 putative transcriptional regulator, MerR family [Alkaliphilus metalliredigens QYMF]
MSEKENKTYSMKDVSQITKFKPHVIRFYEKEFELNIPRASNNRRYFTDTELSQLLTIQSLQEQGLSNKKIKEVLLSQDNHNFNSFCNPEVAMSQVNAEPDSLAIEEQLAMDANSPSFKGKNKVSDDFQSLKNELLVMLRSMDYQEKIEELTMKVDELTSELGRKDQDVLICENAKLKMKIKEKSYEISELKDRIKREQHKNLPFFTRIFSSKKDEEKLPTT